VPGWPALLADGPVGLRPLRMRDAPAWSDLRRRNTAWLAPWEATPPGEPPGVRAGAAPFAAMLRIARREARLGTALPFAVTYDGVLAGQLTIGNIVRGSACSAYAGYWIDGALAGRGIMPAALALAVDHCFTAAGLHRIEANIRPENVASRRVVEKLGFRAEGLRRGFLHIAGEWCDHVCYAVTVEDVPEGMVRRWHARRGDTPA
jgi:ribosomal-protein-alanine N-acetyltransferase